MLAPWPPLGLGDSRVLVTGHTGFKGTWLALWLERLGVRVSGLSLPAEPGSLSDRAGLGGRWPEVLGDIRDPAVVEHAFRTFRPQVVLHLAAQPIVRASYEQPLATFATNVLGTAHVLDAALRAPDTDACVVVTSDKVYRDDATGRARREADPLGGHDPYSASKSAAEMAARAWRSVAEHRGGPHIVTVRAGNVLGGGDMGPDRLLPDLVRAFAGGRTAQIRNPGAVRPWQHVLDPLRAYLLAADALVAGREVPATLNIGPDPAAPLTVAQVCDLVAHAWPGATWTAAAADGPVETRVLTVDADLARRSLGWVPGLTSPQAVAWTARWWRAVLDGESPLSACQADIARYERVIHGEHPSERR